MNVVDKAFAEAQKIAETGRAADAVELFVKILRLKPDHVDTLIQLSEYALVSKRADNAASLLARALALHPETLALHARRAIALTQMGREGEATRLYRRALALNPGHIEVADRLFDLEARAGWIERELPAIGRVRTTITSEMTRVRLAGRASRGTALVAFYPKTVFANEHSADLADHAIQWESREVCRVFLENGYDLDVIDLKSTWPDTGERYSWVFGVDDALLRNRSRVPPGAKTIIWLTGSNPESWNRVELERIAALRLRRSGPYDPKRQLPSPREHLAALAGADHLILIGNQYTLDTYPEALHSRISQMPVSVVELGCIKPADAAIPPEREFLWYAGSGLVHKGLDLVLEVFGKQDRWNLHVVGPVAQEADFCRLYERELFQHPRITTHGRVAGMSESFRRIAARCFAFISPSAAEGMSGSVAACLQVGLYPIMARCCGIDLPPGCGRYLETCAIAEIADAVDAAYRMDEAELRRQIGRTQSGALARNSRVGFASSLRQIMNRWLA